MVLRVEFMFLINLFLQTRYENLQIFDTIHQNFNSLINIFDILSVL